MCPVLLKIGPFNVYSYGAMIALGFIIAAFFIRARAIRFGMNGDKMVDLLAVLLIAGIVGARFLYIITEFKYYLNNPADIFNISQGGLVLYGGFIFAIIAAAFFMNRNHINFWQAADLMAPYIALAQGIGRVGCYLNGCCYGFYAPQGSIFGERYPAQLLSSGLLFLIFIILLRVQSKRRFTGEVFLYYCILYSLKRFGIEFLRGDNPRIFVGLTMSQLISAVILCIAVILLTIRAKRWKTERYTG